MITVERHIGLNPTTSVSSVWALPGDRPAAEADGLILAHGAGNDMHSAFISHLQRELTARGLVTVKFNFPYKEQGRTAPDRTPRLEQTYRAVIEAVQASPERPRRLVIGGKSMGGRIASHLAAQGLPVAGLVLLGYPLHPAGRPEQLRTAHLGDIRCPMLFVQGSRDRLCDLELLQQALRGLNAPVSLHLIEGGDHSFKLPKQAGRSETEVWDEIARAVRDWIAAL